MTKSYYYGSISRASRRSTTLQLYEVLPISRLSLPPLSSGHWKQVELYAFNAGCLRTRTPPSPSVEEACCAPTSTHR